LASALKKAICDNGRLMARVNKMTLFLVESTVTQGNGGLMTPLNPFARDLEHLARDCNATPTGEKHR
jgi:hypothetical protein